MPPPKRAGPSGLNVHAPPFRRRVALSDKEEQMRPVWLPRRPRMEFANGDNEQEKDTEPKPPRRQKNVKRRVYPLIDAEAGVGDNAIADKGPDEKMII